MESERRKATRFASTGGSRLADEALSLVRTTGRRAVLRTIHRAQARATGREASPLHWPRPELAPHYDVIVAGGTLGGLWLAWELARRSELRVAVAERGLVGTSWPSRSGHVLTPLRESTVVAAAVSRSSQLYEETYTEHGFHQRIGRSDVVRLATDAVAARQLQHLTADSTSSAAGVSLVDPATTAELVVHLDSDACLAAVIEHAVPTVEAEVVPWQLGGDAASRGTAMVERCAVMSVVRRGGGWLVETSQGRTEAALLVDATPGAEVLTAAGVPHGCLWQRWETMYTDPVQPFLHAYLLVQGVEIAQTTQGEIRLVTPPTPAPPGPTGPSLDAAAAAAAHAVRVLPPLGRLRLVAQMAQAELLACDGLPVAGDQGAMFGLPGLYRLGGLGPDAAVVAPALAEALATELTDDRPPSWLEACRPERLVGSARRKGATTAGTAG